MRIVRSHLSPAALLCWLWAPAAWAGPYWSEAPSFADLTHGDTIGGVQYWDGRPYEGMLYHHDSYPAVVKGLRERDLARARDKYGVVTDFAFHARDPKVRYYPRDGDGVFDHGDQSYRPDIRALVRVELGAGDWEALEFRLDYLWDWTHAIDTIIGWPRWQGAPELDSQLAQLQLTLGDTGWVREDHGLLLTTDNEDVYVLLTPTASGSPTVAAVIWDAQLDPPGSFEPLKGQVDSWLSDLAQGRLATVAQRHRVLSLHPVPASQRFLAQAADMVQEDQALANELDRRYAQASSLMERLGVLYEARSRAHSQAGVNLSFDQAALLAEIDARLAAAEGNPASQAGWTLVRARVTGSVYEGREAARDLMASSHERLMVVPIVMGEDEDTLIPAYLKPIRALLRELPIHRTLGLRPEDAHGQALFVKLSPPVPTLTVQTDQVRKDVDQKVANPDYADWAEHAEYLMGKFQNATERLLRNRDFYEVHAEYYDNAWCWEVGESRWYDWQVEVECMFGDKLGEDYTFHESKYRAYKEAERERAIWIGALEEHYAQAQPEQIGFTGACDYAYQTWEGSVEQPWELVLSVDRISTGVARFEVRNHQLAKHGPCGDEGARDRWTDADGVAHARTRSQADRVVEQLAPGVLEAVGRASGHVQAQGEEAAWLRFWFGQAEQPGDEALIPRGLAEL
jgi:hypothetical protein